MYWQQQEQRQQQNSQGRSNMRQSSSGWGSPSSGVNKPSLLDMSGKLRNDPSMRSPPAYGPNRGPILGSSRGGGLLPSPPVGFRGGNNQHDMLGQIDNDIDELVAAKVRLQQAMLSAADAERADQQHPRQGFQRQGRYDNNEHQQPYRQQQQQQQQYRQPQQYQQQQQQQQDRQQHDRGYPPVGGTPDRRPGGGARPGSGMRDGRGGRAGGGRGPGGGGGGGLGMENRERRGNGRSDSRGQDKVRKRGSSEIYDPARPTDDETGPTSIGRPVDDLQVTIRQQSRGRAVVDDGGPARKRLMQSSRPASNMPTSQQQASAASEAENDSSWFCHVCSVTCRNIKVYQTHMTGKKHLEAMQKIREVATFQSDQAKARLKAQNYLSKLDGSSGGGSGGGGGSAMGRNNGSDQRMNQRFCRECNRYFRGDRFDHLKTDAHKDAKKRSKPHCNACNLSFKTTQKYVQHCKGDLHKKRRDERIHDAPPTEEENYVTVDAVGFEDDIDVDAALIEMQLEAEEMNHSLETKNQEEDSEEVIVLDSGDDQEPSQEAEADSAPATVGTELPDLSVVIESDQPEPDPKAQLPTGSQQAPELPEGGDQTSGSEPDLEPLQPEVNDVGRGPDSGSDMPDPKMTLTFDDQPLSDTNLASIADNQPLSGVKSVSEVSSEIRMETASKAVLSGESKKVAAVGSLAGSNDPVKAGGDAEQVNKSDQVGASEVSREGKGEEDKPAETVDPTPEPANDLGQPEPKEDQQEEPSPQEEIKELVFDPNKSVGEEYLISVTGFFCKLCHKFLTTEKARRTHCRGKSHFQALKAELEKQKAIDSGTVDQSSSQSSSQSSQ